MADYFETAKVGTHLMPSMRVFNHFLSKANPELHQMHELVKLTGLNRRLKLASSLGNPTNIY